MVLDTDVLVDAANSNAEFHEASGRFINRRIRDTDPTFLTLNVYYEFLRVSTHLGIFSDPFTSAEALDFVNSLLVVPSFSLLVPTDRHTAVLSTVLDELPELRGSIMHDVHTAVLMREHGIRQICSWGSDFYPFPFLTVDPSRERKLELRQKLMVATTDEVYLHNCN